MIKNPNILASYRIEKYSVLEEELSNNLDRILTEKENLNSSLEKAQYATNDR